MANEIEPQLQTMINNMPEKTGKPLEAWFKVLQASKLEKHGEMMKLLKGEHGITHGFANTIAALYRQQAEGGPASEDDLIANQYSKKPDLKPWYDQLIAEVSKFGKDVEIAPKKANVSLRRAKQFGLIQPSTKTRMDLGINLKGVAPSGVLQASDKWGGMCSHLIELNSMDDINDEVIGWLKLAYEAAG